MARRFGGGKSIFWSDRGWVGGWRLLLFPGRWSGTEREEETKEIIWNLEERAPVAFHGRGREGSSSRLLSPPLPPGLFVTCWLALIAFFPA